MRWRYATLGLAGVLLLGGMFFGQPAHPHFWWERLPGFAALFGFAGGWLLVSVGKRLGQRRLQRPEDYYDE